MASLRIETEMPKRSRTPLDADVDLVEVANATAGFSGADLKVLLRHVFNFVPFSLPQSLTLTLMPFPTPLYREAAIMSLRENPTADILSQRHITAALDGAITESDVGFDPFDAVLVPEEKRRAAKIGWWRPAWVPGEMLMQFEAFERGSGVELEKGAD